MKRIIFCIVTAMLVLVAANPVCSAPVPGVYYSFAGNYHGELDGVWTEIFFGGGPGQIGNRFYGKDGVFNPTWPGVWYYYLAEDFRVDAAPFLTDGGGPGSFGSPEFQLTDVSFGPSGIQYWNGVAYTDYDSWAGWYTSYSGGTLKLNEKVWTGTLGDIYNLDIISVKVWSTQAFKNNQLIGLWSDVDIDATFHGFPYEAQMWALAIGIGDTLYNYDPDGPGGNDPIYFAQIYGRLPQIGLKISSVPAPTALLLFSSGLIGLVGFRKKSKG